MSKEALAAYMAEFEQSGKWVRVRNGARYQIATMAREAERATAEQMRREFWATFGVVVSLVAFAVVVTLGMIGR